MNLIIKALTGLIATASLSACMSDSPTTSYVGSVSGTQVNASLSNETNGFVSNAVGTAAYVTGLDATQGQAVAAAGYRNANVGAAVTSGTATYATNYGVAVLSGVERTQTQISGFPNQLTGTTTLTADFDRGTLTGDTTYVDFDATIQGTSLGGTVEVTYPRGASGSGPFDRLDATVAGEIGATGLIGVFHGSSATATLAGGFVGTRN